MIPALEGVQLVSASCGQQHTCAIDAQGRCYSWGLGSFGQLAAVQNGVPVEAWRPGEFLSPHGIGADAAGNLYVLDWNRHGRVSKLERVSPFPGKGAATPPR